MSRSLAAVAAASFVGRHPCPSFVARVAFVGEASRIVAIAACLGGQLGPLGRFRHPGHDLGKERSHPATTASSIVLTGTAFPSSIAIAVDTPSSAAATGIHPCPSSATAPSWAAASLAPSRGMAEAFGPASVAAAS